MPIPNATSNKFPPEERKDLKKLCNAYCYTCFLTNHHHLSIGGKVTLGSFADIVVDVEWPDEERTNSVSLIAMFIIT